MRVLWRERKSVGAGLPAMAVCQPSLSKLTHRYREQAHSYSFNRVYASGGVRGGIWRLLPVDSNAAAKRSRFESS